MPRKFRASSKTKRARIAANPLKMVAEDGIEPPTRGFSILYVLSLWLPARPFDRRETPLLPTAHYRLGGLDRSSGGHQARPLWRKEFRKNTPYSVDEAADPHYLGMVGERLLTPKAKRPT